jgi:hypothetical protein
LVAKTLRDAYSKDKPKTHEHTSPHCCGAMALVNGPKLGYDDLNQLMEKPSDYLFRIGKFSSISNHNLSLTFRFYRVARC